MKLDFLKKTSLKSIKKNSVIKNVRFVTQEIHGQRPAPAEKEE